MAVEDNDQETPFAAFQAQLDRALEVCDLLEALADDLPRRSAVIWRDAKRQCAEVLQSHMAAGQALVLHFLDQSAQITPSQRDVLLRFRGDYAHLAHSVEDLDDLLFDATATDRACVGPEALGYALRSHFEGLRRHIGWERDVLVPMMTRLYGSVDLAVTPLRPLSHKDPVH